MRATITAKLIKGNTVKDTQVLGRVNMLDNCRFSISSYYKLKRKCTLLLQYKVECIRFFANDVEIEHPLPFAFYAVLKKKIEVQP